MIPTLCFSKIDEVVLPLEGRIRHGIQIIHAHRGILVQVGSHGRTRDHDTGWREGLIRRLKAK